MIEFHGMRDEEEPNRAPNIDEEEPNREPNIDEEAPNINEEAPNINEEVGIIDEGFEVDRMLDESLNGDWNNLMEDVLKLVYGMGKLSNLITILQNINFQVVYGWTNESVDELLGFLHQLLPPDSTSPIKQKGQCKTQITKLGLGYENIHTCVNGCLLFHKKLASETKFLKCQEGRYRPRLKPTMVPRKVLFHFPLIP